MRKKQKEKRNKMNAVFAVILVLLVVYTLMMFSLLLIGLNISLKHYSDVERFNNYFGLPNVSLWKGKSIFSNYIDVFKNLKINVPKSYIVGLFNQERVNAPIKGDLITCAIYTVLYAGGGALFSTFMPMFMGYLCAMYKNKVSSIIYAVVLFVIATPIIGSQPAAINLMRSIRLYNTFWGEWIRRASFANMYFLIFVAYFKGLSSGYGEAAEIDGASQLSIMFRIYLPLATSIFFTVYLILFVAYWNDFTTPMMFLPSKPTLAYLIYYKTTVDSGGSDGLSRITKTMAALMVFAIPIIVIFTVFNKRLMSNLTMGGVKE